MSGGDSHIIIYSKHTAVTQASAYCAEKHYRDICITSAATLIQVK
jgi:hypothetical protein